MTRTLSIATLMIFVGFGAAAQGLLGAAGTAVDRAADTPRAGVEGFNNPQGTDPNDPEVFNVDRDVNGNNEPAPEDEEPQFRGVTGAVLGFGR